jgi:hypothetical protein
MPGGYSTTMKECVPQCEPQFGYGSEGEWSHVTACKINHTKEECADMYLILGGARGNSAEAEQLYAERFLNHRTQSATILNTSCELVHLYLFSYLLIK